MTGSIPVVDLSSATASEEIGLACEQVGFFLVLGHEIPPPIIERTWTVARQFFDLPLSGKLQAARPGGPYGYEPPEHRDAAEDGAAPETGQAFDLGPPMRGPGSGIGSHQRVWPTDPYEFRPALLGYYAEMERLAAWLLRLSATALGVDPGFFEPFTDRHLSTLRLLDHSSTVLRASPVRAGAHMGQGTLTIVLPDPLVGGLEVAGGEGEWIPAPTIENSFMVGVGELMHRWTNGRWRSALDNVAVDLGGRRQTSIAFVHNPNWDTVVEPILRTPGEEPSFERVQAGPWVAAEMGQARDS